jgi:hypothetical protein
MDFKRPQRILKNLIAARRAMPSEIFFGYFFRIKAKKVTLILGGKPLCRCAASPPRGNYSGRETPLPLRGISPRGNYSGRETPLPLRGISPRGNYSGRETPLPLRGISPKGEIISYYLVELHSVAEHSPPSPSRSRFGRARPGGNKRG